MVIDSVEYDEQAGAFAFYFRVGSLPPIHKWPPTFPKAFKK
jgi:hypothetical protein